MEGSDVRQIFSSEQFLSSFMMQDPRYLIDDIRSPEIHFDGKLEYILGKSTINVGRIMALMC
jgi:hypothetical protein